MGPLSILGTSMMVDDNSTQLVINAIRPPATVVRGFLQADVDLLQRRVAGAHGIGQPANRVGDNENDPGGCQRSAQAWEIPAVKNAEIADGERDYGNR